MFYMDYIKGITLYNYLYYKSKKNVDNVNLNFNFNFYNNYLYSLYYLLNSIYILNSINIVHNDLHYENILYNFSTNKTLILDFGLSFKYDFLFKHDKKKYDYKRIQMYFFDWRPNHFHHLIEKRFISFIIYNQSSFLDYDIKIENDFEVNYLNKELIDIFINDIYKNIVDDKKYSNLFSNEELQEYILVCRSYYYKFLPENDNNNKYKYISNILNELLPFVLKYNDLWSLTETYIELIYRKLRYEIYNKKYNSKNYIFIYELIKELFKKVLYPVPEYRLNIKQLISIFTFIFKYCKKLNTNNLKDDYIKDFNEKFKSLLKDIEYDYNMFFNKKYSYIDFESILDKENINLIKNFNFNIK